MLTLHNMNIVIIGTGYVGLVTGVGLANLGNTVNFIDLDKDKIQYILKQILPTYTPLDFDAGTKKDKQINYTIKGQA